MRVVLVEDGYLEAGQIKDALAEEYVGVDVVDISTESDFLAALPGLERNPPDLVIMDIMIPWQRPSANWLTPPEAVPREPLRSGIRLLAKLQESSQLRRVPVIVHSALEWHDIEADMANRPEHVLFVHKGQEPGALMTVLRSLMGALGQLPRERSMSLRERIWDAIEASPNLWGVGFKLKKPTPPKRNQR